MIYQNVGCRTDQTSLWVDITRHHHLHYVEDEHIYEDLKCESDGDDILNTNISAIELSNNARHHYTILNTGPLESKLEYPQYSTPLRGANNFHKMSHYPQTHLKNHTFSVNKKDDAHVTYVLVERSSTTRTPSAHQTYNCSKQFNTTYRKCTSSKPYLVPGIRVSTKSTSRKDVPVCGQIKTELSHSGYETDNDDTICGTVKQTTMRTTRGNEYIMRSSLSCFPYDSNSSSESLGIRPPCIGCEDKHHVPNEISNKTYTHTSSERKTCRNRSSPNNVMKVRSRPYNYYKKHHSQMTTL